MDPTHQSKLRLILALVLTGLSLYLLISLVTHDPSDSPRLVVPVRAVLANQCGRFGALVSERLLFAIGYGAYCLALMLAGWAGLYAIGAQLPDYWARVVGSSFILLCVAVLASLQGPIQHASMPGYGGVIGEATALYLQNKFGLVGTYLIAGVVFGISVVLATETVFIQGLRAGAAWATGTLDQLRQGQAERLEAMREQWTAEKQAREAVKAQKRAERDAQRVQKQADREARKARRDQDAAQRKAEKEAERARRVADAETARRKSELEAEARRTVADAEKRKIEREGAQKLRKMSRKVEELIPSGEGYQLPTLELLESVTRSSKGHQSLALEEKAELLESSFEQFGIQARVVNISQGPTIAQFECELGAGIKLSKVTALSNDMAMALQATSVRIVAPLPGKGTFGVEIPNDSRELVYFRELLETDAGKKLALPLVLGKRIDGRALASDLSRMPHLLIAGTTGSGKSFCVNSIIVSLLYHLTPDELKFILVDPKQVELAPFSKIPHLISPTVTDPEKAAGVMEWAVAEMERRYMIFKQVVCRDIGSYQKMSEKQRLQRWVDSGEEEDRDPGQMPYIVIIIDELADLMYTSGKAVEASICRLAQKSRACGIHLVLATQRPSVDVVTGLIKANLPCRISFRVNSTHDSKVILDTTGADKLLGKGDMLFRPPENDGLARAQGAYLSDEEVARVVSYVSAQAQPRFHQDLTGPKITSAGEAEDPLYNQAVRIVLEQQRGSASLLQRALSVGYTRASRLIDIMEENGILGAHKGSKARELLVTLDEWEASFGDDKLDEA